MADFSKISPDDGLTILNAKDATARTQIQNAFNVMGENGAHNLLSMKASNINSTNLTETKNYDARGNVTSVVLNGSSGAYMNFYAMSARVKADAIRLKENTEYIVSIGNSNPNIRFSVGYTNPNGGAYVNVGHSEYGVSEYKFTSPVDNAAWTIQFEAPANTAINNFIIYPMVRLATDIDGTFQPYAMTNKELTNKVSGIISAATNAADFAAFKTAIGNL